MPTLCQASLQKLFSFNCSDNPLEVALEELQSEYGSPEQPMEHNLKLPPSLAELSGSKMVSSCGRPGFPLPEALQQVRRRHMPRTTHPSPMGLCALWLCDGSATL